MTDFFLGGGVWKKASDFVDNYNGDDDEEADDGL